MDSWDVFRPPSPHEPFAPALPLQDALAHVRRSLAQVSMSAPGVRDPEERKSLVALLSQTTHLMTLLTQDMDEASPVLPLPSLRQSDSFLSTLDESEFTSEPVLLDPMDYNYDAYQEVPPPVETFYDDDDAPSSIHGSPLSFSMDTTEPPTPSEPATPAAPPDPSTPTTPAAPAPPKTSSPRVVRTRRRRRRPTKITMPRYRHKDCLTHVQERPLDKPKTTSFGGAPANIQTHWQSSGGAAAPITNARMKPWAVLGPTGRLMAVDFYQATRSIEDKA